MKQCEDADFKGIQLWLYHVCISIWCILLYVGLCIVSNCVCACFLSLHAVPAAINSTVIEMPWLILSSLLMVIWYLWNPERFLSPVIINRVPLVWYTLLWERETLCCWVEWFPEQRPNHTAALMCTVTRSAKCALSLDGWFYSYLRAELSLQHFLKQKSHKGLNIWMASTAHGPACLVHFLE